jgi:hypothetical protein
MGFDLCIRMQLNIDEMTGVPYMYYVDADYFLAKKPYEPIEYKIPDPFQKYICQRGHHFHEYIRGFAENTYFTTVNTFLDRYPEWETVQSRLPVCVEWSEEDHDEFRKALRWMSKTSPLPVFEIYWSY